MKKHFVEFLSPGTFVSEVTDREIDAWDVDTAMAMATDIVERHSARPYGFQFTTRERNDDELDSREIARSGTYYLGGEVLTREQVEARNMPTEEVLRSNMRINDIERIIVNTNSWKFTAELKDKDTVLEFVMPPRPDQRKAS